MVRTLMPEAGSYGVAVLVLNGVSAPALAARLHGSWAVARGMTFARIYMVALGLVVVWGAFVFDARTVIGSSRSWLASVPIGMAAGLLAVRADHEVVLRAHRRRYRPVRSPGYNVSSGAIGDHLANHGFTLKLLLAAAVLEEMIYRGWLLEACRVLGSGLLCAAAMVTTVLAFSLAHLQFGWPHVLSKTPLSLLALAAVLLTGSVIAAVVAHLWFNLHAWRYQQELRGATPG
jgi:membrane protease YdiL (CAAX protease family)